MQYSSIKCKRNWLADYNLKGERLSRKQIVVFVILVLHIIQTHKNSKTENHYLAHNVMLKLEYLMFQKITNSKSYSFRTRTGEGYCSTQKLKL